MKMTLEQTKLVGLTMELDLKTREYQQLCEEFEQVKRTNIDPNDESLKPLLERFVKNQQEILEINKQLNALKADSDK